MKVLLTGTSGIHTGYSQWSYPKTRQMLTELCTQVWDSQDALGWETTYGEPADHDPTDYDLIIAGIYHTRDWRSKQRLAPLLMLMKRAREYGVPLIFYIWDADYVNIADWIKKPARDEKFLDTITRQCPQDYTPVLQEAELFASGYWPSTVVCMHPWAQTQRVSDDLKAPIQGWLDPTGWVHSYGQPVYDRDKKLRQYAFATIKPPIDPWWKGRTTWPIEFLGPPKGELPTDKKPGKWWVPEKKVVALYGQSWASLSHTYGHSGIGWWRPRFGFQTLMGSVVLCPDELRHLGAEFDVYPEDIEGMDNYQLEYLAQQQKEIWNAAVWTREQFIENLAVFAEKVVDGDYGWSQYKEAVK